MSAISPLQAFSSALAGVVAGAAPAVVSVHSRHSRASGFVWRPGLIVTCDESLADEGEIKVIFADGGKALAALAGRDPSTDIALLRVERRDLPPVPLGSAPVAAGALAVSLGAGPSAALGVVAKAGPAWRSLRGGEIDARIELDLRLRRSGEGGLALDASGQAFGMTVFGPRRRVLVIPSATIERVAARLESHGGIARGYLGLGLQPVPLDGGGTGIMVMSADAAGPGAAAGVSQGDVITHWNGDPVRSVQAILRTLGPASVGTAVKLSLLRAGAPLELSVAIGERPAG